MQVKYWVIIGYFLVIWVVTMHANEKRHPLNSWENMSLSQEPQGKLYNYQVCLALLLKLKGSSNTSCDFDKILK